jgi:hypothetical protein
MLPKPATKLGGRSHRVLGIIDVSAVLRTRWYKRDYTEHANRTSTIVFKSAVSESRVRVEFGGAMATVAEVLLEALILSDEKRVYGPARRFAQCIHEFHRQT